MSTCPVQAGHCWPTRTPLTSKSDRFPDTDTQEYPSYETRVDGTQLTANPEANRTERLRFRSFQQADTVRTQGFTLVEMLVSIAIISVLLGLMLPAVHSARESARRVQCSNNLHQVGIALQNYHLAKRTLPPGCLQWRPPGGGSNYKQFAWSAMILPYLEQIDLYESINFSVAYDAPQNQAAGSTQLSIYLCPSAPPPTPGGLGKTDYAGLFGQRITTFKNTNNGVFIYNRAISFDLIRDGLSQTICVAEDTLGPECEWINGRNTFEQSGAINDPKASLIDNEIRSQHTGGALVLFTDGHVSLLANELDKKILAALITRNSRDLIDQTY